MIRYKRRIAILILICLVIGILPEPPVTRAMTDICDFTFINYSEAAFTPREYEGFELSLQELFCEKGQVYFYANAKNISNEEKPFLFGEVYFWSAQGELLGHQGIIVGAPKPGETSFINSSAALTQNIERIYDWSVEFYESEEERRPEPPHPPKTNSSVNVFEQYLYVSNESAVLQKTKNVGEFSLSIDRLCFDRGEMYIQADVQQADFVPEEDKEYQVQLIFYGENRNLLMTCCFEWTQFIGDDQYFKLTKLTGDPEGILSIEDWGISMKLSPATPTSTATSTPTLMPTPTVTSTSTLTPMSTTTPAPTVAPTPALTPMPTDMSSLLPSGRAVRGLKADITERNKVRLSWKKMLGVQSYAIYRSKKRDKGYVFIQNVSSHKNSYVDKKVKKGTRYYYKVVTNTNSFLHSSKAVSVDIPYLHKPTIQLKKSMVENTNYIQISLCKYEGTLAEIYVKRKKKFLKLKVKKKNIAYYKNKYCFRYQKKGQILYFKIRTYKKVNGRNRYSAYSSVKKIKT